MAALLVSVLSPANIVSRRVLPGVAFLASIAYSVYLSHKLVIHGALALCARLNLAPTSAAAIVMSQLLIYAAGTALFFTVERLFLRLRESVTKQ